MVDASDVEKAERLGRTRARLFAAQALLFVSWQGLYFSEGTQSALRTVDQVKVWTWLVWVLALLMLIATGGGLMRSRRIRALLNDELTRANRAQAYVAGFWAAMVAAVGLYVISLFDPVRGGEAIHYIVSASIGAALITFAVRERRSADSS